MRYPANLTATGTLGGQTIYHVTVAYGRNALYMFKYHVGGVRTIAEWNYQWEPQTYFYTPEMNLLSYTKQRMPGTSRPDMDEDIVWFAGMPVGQKFIAVNNGSTRWTCPDHLGTPVMQTDGGGAVVWQPQYEPYGQVWTMTTGARTDQILRFPGQEDSYDENGNAVYYNIFRWYGAGWGRYTQADPIGLLGGFNLYRYANSDPLGFVDPFGRYAAKTCCKGGEVAVCPGQNLIEPAKMCVEAHEQQHIRDIKKWAPCEPCKYRRDGEDVGTDSDFREWGAPPEAPAATECAAYKIEIDCLRKHRDMAPNPGMVDKAVDDILSWLDQHIPTCFAGQTWR